MQKILCAILVISVLSGCTTYHLSAESLVEQFSDVHPETKKLTFVVLPLFYSGTVTGNSLDKIKVLDEKGQEHVIPVNGHTGVRITKKDGTRKTFYFDTLLIKDSTINGKKSHLLNLDINPINLNNIASIEIQR